MVLCAKMSFVVFLLALIYQADIKADVEISEKGFDDTLLDEGVELPDWFKLSFLDIKEDIEEAKESGKKGLMLYFGMSKCPYCKALIENNFGREDIAKYTQKNFDVVAIDVKGSRNVKTTAGKNISEQKFSIINNAHFTPTVIFYNHEGKEVHRLVGYYAAYRFQAALEYVADSHYKKEPFKSYLARGGLQEQDSESEINYRVYSMNKPYVLGRKTIKSQRPLLVIFEKENCHACDVLHEGVLNKKSIAEFLTNIDVVQLNISHNSPVITPDEKRVSAKTWADDLNIFYTPTLIFYDESGKEVIRLGSVAHFNRLNNVIQFIKTRAYRHYNNYAEWIRKQ